MLDDASLFIDAVRAGGVRALARQRGVPRSTVSRALNRLETTLGVTLVARASGRLKLTQAGEESFDRLAAAVDEARAMLDELGASGREVRGLLRVTSTPIVGELLPKAIAAYLEAHPGARVELLPSSEKLDLEAQRVDVALRAGPPPDSDRFTARRCGKVSLGFFASPRWLKAHGPVASLDAVEDLLVTQRAGGTWLLGNEARRVTARVHADDLSLLQQLCERGLGIARLPLTQAAVAVREGRLAAVLETASLEADVHLVYRVKPPAKVKAFVAACVAAFTA